MKKKKKRGSDNYTGRFNPEKLKILFRKFKIGQKSCPRRSKLVVFLRDLINMPLSSILVHY